MGINNQSKRPPWQAPRFLPRTNAIIAAAFFCAFEGTFWKGAIYLWQGEWLAVFPLIIAALCFAMFITFAAREVRG